MHTADAAVQSHISQGIFFGLLIGKPIGIFLVTFIAVKARICEMPTSSTWLQVLGIGMLGGIGFTVALADNRPGLRHELFIDEAKLGVLTASAASGLVGFIFLWLTTRRYLRPRTGGMSRALMASADETPAHERDVQLLDRHSTGVWRSATDQLISSFGKVKDVSDATGARVVPGYSGTAGRPANTQQRPAWPVSGNGKVLPRRCPALFGL